MSVYKNFVQDFPERCMRLLKRNEKMHSDLEITQLFMIASCVLIIPYERLKDRNNSLEPEYKKKTRKGGEIVANHPDVREFYNLASSIHEELKSLLREGNFWKLIQFSAKYDTIERPSGIELSAKYPIPTDMTTEKFFNILRNGLAHGNIFVEGNDDRNIVKLTFGQSRIHDSDDYEFITLSVGDFRQLLMGWTALLFREGLETGVISTDKKSAA